MERTDMKKVIWVLIENRLLIIYFSNYINRVRLSAIENLKPYNKDTPYIVPYGSTQ